MHRKCGGKDFVEKSAKSSTGKYSMRVRADRCESRVALGATATHAARVAPGDVDTGHCAHYWCKASRAFARMPDERRMTVRIYKRAANSRTSRRLSVHHRSIASTRNPAWCAALTTRGGTRDGHVQITQGFYRGGTVGQLYASRARIGTVHAGGEPCGVGTGGRTAGAIVQSFDTPREPHGRGHAFLHALEPGHSDDRVEHERSLPLEYRPARRDPDWRSPEHQRHAHAVDRGIQRTASGDRIRCVDRRAAQRSARRTD
ncbi:hypothetical protein PT2222_360035 [Paraburkholderia tropica]